MALEVSSIRVTDPSPAPVGAAARPRPAVGRPVPTSGTALPPAPVSKQSLQTAVRHLNEHVREAGGEVEFSISIDKATDRPVVKIIDRTTKAVIRQIPPQDILSLDHRLQQLAGLLLRARA